MIERYTMITTIIFDMGNVLIDFRWEKLFEEMGFTGEKFDRMAKATVLSPIWNECDRGVWSDDEIFDAFVANDPELKEDIRSLMYDNFTGFLKKFDYTDDWLDSLKAKGYKIYILSNFSRRSFEECPDELDYVSKADGAVISCYVKMIKPEPGIYRHILDTYDIDPKEAVFIDDNPDNIAAAEKFGITGILFTGLESAKKQLKELGVE